VAVLNMQERLVMPFWSYLPTYLIPNFDFEKRHIHSLCSGHRCKQCYEKALMRLVCAGKAKDRNLAERALRILISLYHARNGNIGCSAEFYEIS